MGKLCKKRILPGAVVYGFQYPSLDYTAINISLPKDPGSPVDYAKKEIAAMEILSVLQYAINNTAELSEEVEAKARKFRESFKTKEEKLALEGYLLEFSSTPFSATVSIILPFLKEVKPEMVEGYLNLVSSLESFLEKDSRENLEKDVAEVVEKLTRYYRYPERFTKALGFKHIVDDYRLELKALDLIKNLDAENLRQYIRELEGTKSYVVIIAGRGAKNAVEVLNPPPGFFKKKAGYRKVEPKIPSKAVIAVDYREADRQNPVSMYVASRGLKDRAVDFLIFAGENYAKATGSGKIIDVIPLPGFKASVDYLHLKVKRSLTEEELLESVKKEYLSRVADTVGRYFAPLDYADPEGVVKWAMKKVFFAVNPASLAPEYIELLSTGSKDAVRLLRRAQNLDVNEQSKILAERLEDKKGRKYVVVIPKYGSWEVLAGMYI